MNSKFTPTLPLGVIFDMDGVLVDSENIINQSSRQMFAEHGFDVNPEDFAPFVGTGEDQFIMGVAQKYGFQIDVTAAKKRTYDLYLENIKGNLKPIPGVFDFIKREMQQDVKLVNLPVILLTAISLAEDALVQRHGQVIVRRPDGLSPVETLRCLGAVVDVLEARYDEKLVPKETLV